MPEPETPAPDEEPLSDAEAHARLAPLAVEFRSAALVLAVSGGPDSVALMRFTAPIARETGTRAIVCTVDHGLRREAEDEARRVAAWADAVGLPCRILRRSAPPTATRLQEAARAARYRLLVDAAHEAGAGAILTAHHRDDQAETVLMRLAAGSGPAGLAGMRPRTTVAGLVLARPFLDLPKARLVAACRARGWDFVEDPSNASPLFARGRLRATADALAREGLDARRLARLARRAARADDALDAVAREAHARMRLPGSPPTLDARGLAALPEEIALRVLAGAIAEAAPEAGRIRLARLEAAHARIAPALAAGGRARTTIGGVVVTVADGRVGLVPEPRRRARDLAEPLDGDEA